MHTRLLCVAALVAGVGCGSESEPADMAINMDVPVGPGVNQGTGGGGSVIPTNPNPDTQVPPDQQNVDPGQQNPNQGTGGTGMDPTVNEPVAGGAAPDEDPTVPAGNCEEQGLDLEGMMYSPGGNVLPHPCEPFHATLNNPYAVRCVDAWPWYETQFPGDEFCILPPEPGKGVQIGVHPQGLDWYNQVSQQDMSGYANPSDPFVMDPGDEEEANYSSSTTTTEGRNYYRTYVRMRAGSHHSIVATGGAVGTESWGPGSPTTLFSGESIPGAQRPDDNTPDTLEKPPEDEGLYRFLPGNSEVIFNMHHFNSTQEVTLKEGWTNIWWEEDARTQIYGILGLDVVQVGLMNIPPGDTQDYHYVYDVTQPFRVISLFGHRHAWTTNFSTWVERADGGTDILYQSFDWYDQPTFRYNSGTENPLPSKENKVDGAYSGMYEMQPGDRLHFNCHIEFTQQRAAEVGAPTPSEIGTLRFANQAFQGEMCILFGSTSGLALGPPPGATTQPPDFAR